MVEERLRRDDGAKEVTRSLATLSSLSSRIGTLKSEARGVAASSASKQDLRDAASVSGNCGNDAKEASLVDVTR